MKRPLIVVCLLVSGGAVVVGSWVLSDDALTVVIASLVWVLAAGWFITRVEEL